MRLMDDAAVRAFGDGACGRSQSNSSVLTSSFKGSNGVTARYSLEGLGETGTWLIGHAARKSHENEGGPGQALFVRE